MLVREAVLGDEAGIARVHVASWRETYGDLFDERFFGEEMLERRLCFWRDYLQLSPCPGRMAVAVDAGHIVGFANAGDSVGQDAEHGNPSRSPPHTVLDLPDASWTPAPRRHHRPRACATVGAGGQPPGDRVLPAQRLQV